MRKQLSILLILLLSLFLVSSCEKEVPLAPDKTGTLDMFPNTLGRQWTYHMVDNLRPIDSTKPEKLIDTVYASISEKLTDPVTGEEATIWRYLTSNRPPIIRPVFFKGDTVYIYWNWEILDKIGLVFPFSDRDQWRTGGFLSGDQTTVKEIITARVPAGLFENVYVLENVKRTTIPEDKRTITMWFVPNLGPIKIHLHEEHLKAIGDTTWTLVDHNFPGFN